MNCHNCKREMHQEEAAGTVVGDFGEKYPKGRPIGYICGLCKFKKEREKQPLKPPGPTQKPVEHQTIMEYTKSFRGILEGKDGD